VPEKNARYTAIMNPYLFIGIIIAVLWAVGLFLGAVKGMSKSFENAPTVESTSSREVREKFSEKAAEIDEKNRRLMEDVKSKMERGRF
jgi:hypothetical protein